MRAELKLLEAALGYRFRDGELLRRALTHKSLVFETSTAGEPPLADNEQIEFLGDSILGFLISEELLKRYPSLPEGRLSKLKAFLVSEVHLHEVAQGLALGGYLFLGRGEEMSGGRTKKTLLANAVEALIAALYLDGGMDQPRNFVERFVLAELSSAADASEGLITDFKSALQEAAQALRLPQPRYVTVKERGPEHAKTFTVEVRVGRDYASQADGFSKKAASQKAARTILEKLQSPGEAGATT
jgi:ribonuclease III